MGFQIGQLIPKHLLSNISGATVVQHDVAVQRIGRKPLGQPRWRDVLHHLDFFGQLTGNLQRIQIDTGHNDQRAEQVSSELMIRGKLHGQERFTPLLEPWFRDGNVHEGPILQLDWSYLFTYGRADRFVEHFFRQNRLRRSPVDVAHVYAETLNGNARTGGVAKVR